MEQRDQGDERDEDALVTATVVRAEDMSAQLGWLEWLREHDCGCKGGAEDVEA